MEHYFTLENEWLKIRVADCPHAAYNSSRFDWTGFVTDIIFDGEYSFAGAESLSPADPMACGRGICNEFRVPDYAAATPRGEKFLKPGVGLLTQREDGQAWKFDHRYAIFPFPIRQMHGRDWISYQVSGADWQGVHINAYKTLRLVGSSIIETITLDNIGDAAFHCVDYNHNFFSINQLPFGPDYRLETPDFPDALMRASITMGNLIVKDGAYTWDGPCAPECRTMTRDGLKTATSYVWGLYHDRLGVGLREYLDIPYEEFCIWAAPFVCTPKVLAPVDIAPHASKTWTRRWEFVHI